LHNKGIFALAGVFLAVALVMPIVFFVFSNQINDLIVVQNPTGTQTNGNSTGFTPQNVAENSGNTLVILVVIEVIFISLFIVTAYYGIKHVHPYH
jgi:hypothetical protein